MVQMMSQQIFIKGLNDEEQKLVSLHPNSVPLSNCTLNIATQYVVDGPWEPVSPKESVA